MSNNIKKMDPAIASLIEKEAKRQRDVLEMIPSENYASSAVREAVGSILANKYSEGYPHKRYYQGNRYIDDIENLAIARAKKVIRRAACQRSTLLRISGQQRSLHGLLKPGDTIMGLKLSGGGHLTHGHRT